jgi:hypothetical protein
VIEPETKPTRSEGVALVVVVAGLVFGLGLGVYDLIAWCLR